MDLSRMVETIRILLGEPDSDDSHYTDTEIKNTINDVSVNVAAELEENITFCDYLTVDGTYRYALPADFLKFKMLKLIKDSNHYSLEYKNLIEFEDYAGTMQTREGTPRICKVELGRVSVSQVYPGDIWVFPVPDTDNWTLRLYYYQKPSTLTSDGHISELPELIHLGVCYYAAAILSQKSSEFSKFNDFMSLYRIEIDKANSFYAVDQRNRPTVPRDPWGYTRTDA